MPGNNQQLKDEFVDRPHKVSVIVTVRNEEKNIPILLDGLLRQTYKFEEIVINDNGSTDRTVEIIRGYQSQYKYIKLIESGGRSIGEGRNAAIENSCGDIFAIMDSGILPKDNWLEKVVNPLLEDQTLDVAWGHVVFDTKSRIVPSSDLSLALVFLTKYSEGRKDGKNVTSSAFRRKVWEYLGNGQNESVSKLVRSVNLTPAEIANNLTVGQVLKARFVDGAFVSLPSSVRL